MRNAYAMRTPIVAGIAAAALVSLTACSSSSHDDSAPTTPPSTTAGAPSSATPTSTQQADAAALTQAVRDYTADLFSGNAAGYKFVSARCAKQMSRSAWSELAVQAHHQYGSQVATGIHIDQQSGDLARVSYGAGQIPQFTRTGQSWTREGGTWRWDACPSTG